MTDMRIVFFAAAIVGTAFLYSGPLLLQRAQPHSLPPVTLASPQVGQVIPRHAVLAEHGMAVTTTD